MRFAEQVKNINNKIWGRTNKEEVFEEKLISSALKTDNGQAVFPRSITRNWTNRQLAEFEKNKTIQ